MTRLVLTAVVAFAAAGLAADVLAEFQAAFDLFEQRQWADAATAFSGLADRAPTAQRDTCHSHAARALAAAGRYDEAMATARRVEDPAWNAYTRMAVMDACGKTNELLAAFGAEPLDAWPDEIAYLGFLMRGSARGAQAEAVPDLSRAAEEAGSDSLAKSLALNRLIKAAWAAGDTAAALEAADQAVGLSQWKGKWFWFDSALQKARLLTAERRWDEAQQTLDLVRTGHSGKPDDLLRFYELEARADLEWARGNGARATALYQEALGMTVPAVMREALRKKVDGLQPGQAPP